jgi:hypothetical protein
MIQRFTIRNEKTKYRETKETKNKNVPASKVVDETYPSGTIIDVGHIIFMKEKR